MQTETIHVENVLVNINPQEVPQTMLERKPVEYHEIPAEVLDEFNKALNEAEAEHEEKPMQLFFERYPVALLCLLSPHRAWVFPRQILNKPCGGGWQPDFLLCDWNSNGPEWTIVELESPSKKAINGRGLSADLRHAQQQISDYRTYMSDHSQSLNGEGLIGTQYQARSVIVIDRRSNHDPQNQNRLRDLRRDGIEVMSYDRLKEKIETMVNLRNAEYESTKEWTKKPTSRQRS